MERLLELLAKKKSRSLTPAEQVELTGLLSSDSAREFSDIIDELFQASSELRSVEPVDINLSVSKVMRKISFSEHKKERAGIVKLWRTVAAAAVILLAVGLGSYLFMQNGEDKSTSGSIVQTKKGSKSNTTLPDGSRVWINSDTKLTYEKSFGEKTREVVLEGEAYFDVMEDKNRPFIVHTKDMDIKVIGTSFNVRAYSDETTSQTTLMKGSVEVQLRNENKGRIVLKPNEKVIVKHNMEGDDSLAKKELTPQLAIIPVESKLGDTSYIEIQWINNRLAFADQTLAEIIPVLERWYDINIELDKNLINKRLFNGVFESDNLDDVMRTLSLTLGFNYRINADKIYIF